MLTDVEIDEAVEKLKTVGTAQELKQLKDAFFGNSGLIKQALSILKQASMSTGDRMGLGFRRLRFGSRLL